MCYSLWTPREAAIGALLYLLVLGGAITLLAATGRLGLETAYAALGGSSLVACGGWLWRVAITRDEAAELQAGALTLRAVTHAHFAFARYGLETEFPQCNTSYSRSRGTLRGLHYQSAPHPDAKLVRATRGRVLAQLHGCLGAHFG